MFLFPFRDFKFKFAYFDPGEPSQVCHMTITLPLLSLGHMTHIASGLSIELSDREKLSSIQGECFKLNFEFLICSIHLHFSLFSK